MVIIIDSPKPMIVSRASETHCGPAKIDFGWPDWPAREKVKHDPCLHYGVCNRVRCFYYHVTGTKRPHLNHRDVNRPSNNGHHNNSDSQRSRSNNQNSENSYYNFNRNREYDNNHGRQYRSGGRS